MKKKAGSSISRNKKRPIYLIVALAVVILSLIVGAIWSVFNQQSDNAQAGGGFNLNVDTASFLGGSGEDRITATEILPDKTVVMAGILTRNDFNKTTNVVSPGNGFVARFSTNGKEILGLARFSSEVQDMDINRTTGQVVAVGDFGLVSLSSDLQQTGFVKPAFSTSGGNRVAVGDTGAVAWLSKSRVFVYDAAGTVLNAGFVPSGKIIADVAISGSSQTVIVVGESQKDGAPCSQYRAGWMRGYNYAGQVKWTNYDWNRDQVGNDCADAMPIRTAIGRDGKLYMAAESAGGNSVFRWDPRQLSKSIQVKTDMFTNAFNTASNHITFVGKYDAATGNIDQGQFYLSRLSSGAGNTIKPLGITADEAGNIFLVGQANANFPDRVNRDNPAFPPQLSINNTLIGPYSGLDGYMLQISPDFKQRQAAAWTGNRLQNVDSRTSLTSVAAFSGVRVVGGHNLVGEMITVSPIQSTRNALGEGFYSVWGSVTSSSSSSQDVVPPISSQSSVIVPPVIPGSSSQSSSLVVSSSSSSVSSSQPSSSVSSSSSVSISSQSSSISSSSITQSSSLSSTSSQSSINSSISQSSISSQSVSSSTSQFSSSTSTSTSSSSSIASQSSSSQFSSNISNPQVSSSSSFSYSQNVVPTSSESSSSLPPVNPVTNEALDIQLSIPKFNFRSGETVRFTSRVVRANGLGVASVTCKFTLVNPYGNVMVISKTTDSSGFCTFNLSKGRVFAFLAIPVNAQNVDDGDLQSFLDPAGSGYSATTSVEFLGEEFVSNSVEWSYAGETTTAGTINVIGQTIRSGGAGIIGSAAVISSITGGGIWFASKRKRKLDTKNLL